MLIQQNDLSIRNATISDANILGTWWRDGKVMAHAGLPNGLTISNEEILEELLKQTDESGRRLIIELNERPIGEMSYWNKGNGVAEIGIKICDFEKHEKGYGTRLYKMLMHALFGDYNYSTIITSTNVKNLRAQHVYEKIGFRRVGLNVDAWKDQLGVLQSTIDYEIKKDEFTSGIV